MPQSVPTHIAFIPDGNRRWAKERGLAVRDGHEKGVAIFQDVMNHAADRGVKVVSTWGMSVDNFIKRSPREIADLISIFQNEFERLLHDKDIHGRGIRVRVFGRWQEKFPRKLRQAIEKVEDATKEYSSYAMNLLLAYNGTDEMVQAVRNIVHSVPPDKGGIRGVRITSKTIKQHLFTKDLPPVDLLVRTGGEPHLSTGFMMWDTADAELYFTKKFWPAFDNQEFDLALADYATRRRMGGK